MYYYEVDTVAGTYNAPDGCISPRFPRAVLNALLPVQKHPNWEAGLQPYCTGRPRLVTLRYSKSAKVLAEIPLSKPRGG